MPTNLRRVILAASLATVLLPRSGRADMTATTQQAGASPLKIVELGPADTFDVAGDGGTLHALFGRADPTRRTMAFYHRRSSDGGATWSPPVRVDDDGYPPADRLHRGNDVRLAVQGTNLVAVWTLSGDAPMGSGGLATAVSSDGGVTWRRGGAPRSDGGPEPVGFRFPAIAAGGDAFHLVWIHAQGQVRSLRAARSVDAGAAWTEPVTVDERICACCWNAIAAAEDGQVCVLYRDQQPSDMALVTSSDGGASWARSGVVGDFDWEFEGCPHVGGGVALGRADPSAPELFATVWTGRSDAVGAYRLHSPDGGQSWSGPLRLGASDGAKNTDICTGPSGGVAAAWDEWDGKARVVLASWSQKGSGWSPPLRVSPPGASATHPRAVWIEQGLRVFWTQHGDDDRVLLVMAAPQ